MSEENEEEQAEAEEKPVAPTPQARPGAQSMLTRPTDLAARPGFRSAANKRSKASKKKKRKKKR